MSTGLLVIGVLAYLASLPDVFTWLICILTVTLLCAEGQLLVNAFYFSRACDLHELARVYNKTGLPILWGLCSFAFMWLGTWQKLSVLLFLIYFSVRMVKAISKKDTYDRI